MTIGKSAAHAAVLEKTLQSIALLRRGALAIEGELASYLRKSSPTFRQSARNLAHYLAVRRHDIRELQQELGKLGLSSLGRMEAHVMAALDAVQEALCLLQGQPVPDNLNRASQITFDIGHALLAENAVAVLGPMPPGRNARIMVTMPSEAAEEPAFIRDLLAGGMNIMRINGAHDNPQAWERMVAYLRKAEKELGTSCKVCFDLAGPKLRTGVIEPAEGVAKWKPLRNRFGQFVAPALVGFIGECADMEAMDRHMIPVRGDLFVKARAGDAIHLVDARGRGRALEIVEVSGSGCLCQADRTTYVTEGVALLLKRKGRTIARGTIGTLPLEPLSILLRAGDRLDVVSGEILGRNAVRDEDGTVVEPAVVGCTLDEVFSSARPGERIFFDDGKVAGMIRGVSDACLQVEITSIPGGTYKLRDEKGINLPDTHLGLPALSPKDRRDLAFAVRHADMMAMSFVQQPKDIEALLAELHRHDAAEVGIVLKIETARAFASLPGLLLTAMRHDRVAVMVARGDLGVEVGFERLSEIQEEILWLCEAAHIPVIWATQVLESLAKGGMPSRAEVTDAAMGARAECVMLNKGPYILQTMEFLRDVLTRMQSHVEKKTAMLRRLSVSDMRQPGRKRLQAKAPTGRMRTAA